MDSSSLDSLVAATATVPLFTNVSHIVRSFPMTIAVCAGVGSFEGEGGGAAVGLGVGRRVQEEGVVLVHVLPMLFSFATLVQQWAQS